MKWRNRILSLATGLALPLSAAAQIVPNPQYMERAEHSLRFPPGSSAVILVGSGQKIRLAADFLRTALVQAEPSLRVSVEPVSSHKQVVPAIHLWNYTADHAPPL